MPLPGKRRSTRTQPKQVARFFLDECLPHRIADGLSMNYYPVTCSEREGNAGWDDEILIPWLGEQKFTWITRDHRARTQHRDDIIAAGISVVWVRGVVHKSGTIAVEVSMRDVFRMLAWRLDELITMIEESSRPRYYVMSLNRDRNVRIQTHSALDEVLNSIDSQVVNRRRRARRKQ